MSIDRDRTAGTRWPIGAWSSGLDPWIAPWIAMVVLLGVARLAALEREFPYVQNYDERYIMVKAADIIRTGDLNPRSFRYPSLPIYLTTGSLLLGDLVSTPGFREGEAAPFRVVDAVGEPYDRSDLARYPRTLFVLFSVATFGLMGVIAWAAFRSGLALLLTPLLLGVSGVYQDLSLSYLNVDVAACFFAAATLAVVFVGWSRDSLIAKSIVPGLFAGMTVACKYNSGLILVPCALAIAWSTSEGRGLKIALLGACAGFAFFVCVPHSLLDYDTFVRDVLFEMRHYQRGHVGHDGEPGLPQLLFYGKALVRDYGSGLVALSALGLCYGLVVDPKRTLTLFSFPALMLLYMSTLRVHFLRTILPVFTLVPVFAAFGVEGLARLVARIWRTWAREERASSRNLWLFRIATICAVVAMVALLHGERLLDRNIEADSRNLAATWLEENVDSEAVVLLPADLWFDPTALSGLRTVDVAPGGVNLGTDLAANEASVRYLLVPSYEIPPEPRGRKRTTENLRKWVAAPLRVVEIEKRWKRAVEHSGASRVLDLPGRPIHMPLDLHQVARPALNPDIAIYRIPAGR